MPRNDGMVRFSKTLCSIWIFFYIALIPRDSNYPITINANTICIPANILKRVTFDALAANENAFRN